MTNKWSLICHQRSTGKIVFIDKDELPTKGLARLSIALPEAYPVSFCIKVEYLAVDGIVIDIDLIKSQEDLATWNEKLDGYIKDVEVVKNYRV